MNRHFRRALLGLTSVATSTALVAGAGLSAPVSAATPEARSAGGWLAGELTGGLVHNRQFDFDDYGLTLDVHFALDEIGARQKKQARILRAVESHVADYTTFAGTTYAGAVAKLLTAVRSEGIKPRTYGDGSLVPTLRGLVQRTGAQAGRASDDGDGTDTSNTIGQSFAVRAFAATRNADMTGLTTRFLLKQQCDRGYFREGMDSSDFTCEAGRGEGAGTPSVDSTSFALVALQEARAAGVRGLGDDIRDATRWLRRHQNANGSFTGNGVPNANTTGLAAWALADASPKTARRAATWISRLQVTSKKAKGTPLRRDVGAVAYDRAAFRTARQQGITRTSEDQWRRATAQTVVALDLLRTARR